MLDALGIKLHVFRKWVENLDPYASQEVISRGKRIFGRQDLMFFSIVFSLINDFGMRMDMIAKFSKTLHELLDSQLPFLTPGSVFFDIETYSVSPIRTIIQGSGFIVDLSPHIQRCASYFNNAQPRGNLVLPFEPEIEAAGNGRD